MPDGPEVFISYRVLDNHPPPDGPARGFVDYLLTQIRYDLTQLGIPDAILWQDRSKIAPADDWNDNILSALNSAQLFIAILSKNYITSDWCNKELDTMTSRVETLDARARERRIFRVDKHKVPENKVPISLRTVQSVQFYREDRYSDSVDEYFWRGKVRYIDEYEGAVKKLAQGICSRLEELGIPCQPRGRTTTCYSTTRAQASSFTPSEPGLDGSCRSDGARMESGYMSAPVRSG